MVGMVTPSHGTVLLVVVVDAFGLPFGKDNWNCMRITRYVVTAPTICKIIHWGMSLKGVNWLSATERGIQNSCNDGIDVQNCPQMDRTNEGLRGRCK
jgi:hypothetical protein